MSILVDTLTETVMDGIENACETAEEQVDALERVVHSLTLHLRDLEAGSGPDLSADASPTPGGHGEPSGTEG